MRWGETGTYLPTSAVLIDTESSAAKGRRAHLLAKGDLRWCRRHLEGAVQLNSALPIPEGRGGQEVSGEEPPWRRGQKGGRMSDRKSGPLTGSEHIDPQRVDDQAVAASTVTPD
ncbi:hypothetical protein NDU88_001310 [Pleurodeles waltl]|uniref:Uncharacterized protein n=1 Tax=Pleurodeles waltl TaxID=8319 RepID=A0AAV7THZ0_PLEWA|nr:hypothetical protein NDU88_001310 [Pleurodeles waltl]